MSAALATVEGVTFEIIEGQPKARDLDVAAKLGFERPRKIREIIARWVSALGPLEQRPLVGRYEIRPGIWHEQTSIETWLTEEQAYFVAAKSDTPEAVKFLKDLIRVYMRVKEEQLAARTPPVLPPPHHPDRSISLHERPVLTDEEVDAAVRACSLVHHEADLDHSRLFDLARARDLLLYSRRANRFAIAHHPLFLQAVARLDRAGFWRAEEWVRQSGVGLLAWREALAAHRPRSAAPALSAHASPADILRARLEAVLAQHPEIDKLTAREAAALLGLTYSLGLASRIGVALTAIGWESRHAKNNRWHARPTPPHRDVN